MPAESNSNSRHWVKCKHNASLHGLFDPLLTIAVSENYKSSKCPISMFYFFSVLEPPPPFPPSFLHPILLDYITFCTRKLENIVAYSTTVLAFATIMNRNTFLKPYPYTCEGFCSCGVFLLLLASLLLLGHPCCPSCCCSCCCLALLLDSSCFCWFTCFLAGVLFTIQ
jgi:hypothetical protein